MIFILQYQLDKAKERKTKGEKRREQEREREEGGGNYTKERTKIILISKLICLLIWDFSHHGG